MKGSKLEIRGLNKSYGGVKALQNVNFTVDPGELVGLIGPNGSGKTTAVDCISGLQSPDMGSILLDGREILGSSPHELAKRGVVRTFQATRVFDTLSVQDNLRTALIGRTSGVDRLKSLSLSRARSNPSVVVEIIEELRLGDVTSHAAGSLSYGQRKLVEFATACVVPPSTFLLDEPVAAVNPTLANVLKDRILALHNIGVTILIVEHNIELINDICDRVVVLDHGVKIADEVPQVALANPAVQEAYFGH